MSAFAAIIPIVIVALSAIAAMLAESIRRPGERMPIFGFGLIGSGGAALASYFLWNSNAESFGVIRCDNFTIFVNIVLCRDRGADDAVFARGGGAGGDPGW